MTRIEQLRKIVEQKQLGLVDNQWVDLTTAHMLVTVYDALKTDELRAKFERIGLMRLVDFGWKNVKVGGGS